MKYGLSNMMALDLYLSSLNENEYAQVSQKLNQNKKVQLPLMSWDIFSETRRRELEEAQRSQDILKVRSLAKRFGWENDMSSIFEQQQFEAILITDINQNIIWVNQGFTTMTGYSKNEVLDKTPRLLQGIGTSNTSRNHIRTKLDEDVHFTEVIVNYRKNKTAYRCEVKIFPLRNNKTTHFIALERQVS
ncbi:PAS domain-containing protein [uncultured Psychroserpens sp.]|uniref:PAS domain-containing protein n=1 Tax=uncultured Psychroserpens sp. TaxID=255436 RepID=UPI0026039E86|nr:PAS domain-containing protein [uncultured Psychroserpens sp.]